MQQKPVVADTSQTSHTERAHAPLQGTRLQHMQEGLQQPELAEEPQEHLPQEREKPEGRGPDSAALLPLETKKRANFKF